MPTKTTELNMGATIVARKPRGTDCEYVVVDRGYAPFTHRYVSATVNSQSLGYGEWFWGHYFATLPEALAHFNGRS